VTAAAVTARAAVGSLHRDVGGAPLVKKSSTRRASAEKKKKKQDTRSQENEMNFKK
jgi:hypothetical protein